MALSLYLEMRDAIMQLSPQDRNRPLQLVLALPDHQHDVDKRKLHYAAMLATADYPGQVSIVIMTEAIGECIYMSSRLDTVG